MLVERRAKAQERRVVPETIARFMHEAAEYVPLRLRSIDKLPHAFEPARKSHVKKKYEVYLIGACPQSQADILCAQL